MTHQFALLQRHTYLSDLQKLLKMLKKTKDAKKSVQLQQLLTRMASIL